MENQPTLGNPLFQNEYIVSQESAQHSSSPPREAQDSPIRQKRWKRLIPAIGLGIAAAIIFIAAISEQPLFLFIGIALAALYTFRMIVLRREPQHEKIIPSFRPQTLSWKRIIRFADDIEVTDPSGTKKIAYEEITRVSDGQAYCNLFLTDLSVLRIYKKGFTVGAWEDFLPWITKITGQRQI